MSRFASLRSAPRASRRDVPAHVPIGKIRAKGPRDATFAQITHYPDRSDEQVSRPAFISVHRYKSHQHWVRGIPAPFVRRYGQEVTVPRTCELDPSQPPEPGRYRTLSYFAYKADDGIWRHDADVRTIGARTGDRVEVLSPRAAGDARRFSRRSSRRDPPAAGEFERNQRMRELQILFLVPEGEREVVALFQTLRRGDRKLVYRESTGGHWLTEQERLRLLRRSRRAKPEEKRALFDHLVHDHGYPIRPSLRSSA